MNFTYQTLKGPGILAPIVKDRVLLFMALILATLLVFAKNQALASLQFTGRAWLQILPFFLMAILLAAYAKASRADQLITRAFSGSRMAGIVVGALAGALSPFCSCGVIPVIAGMLTAGVPLAPVMAFCIASPIMDPEMFILTAAGIDLHFAFAKTVTAIAMGMFSGLTVLGLQRLGYLTHPLKHAVGCGCSQTTFDAPSAVRPSWRFWQDPTGKDTFYNQIKTNGFFLGKWMTLAFLLESLMVATIPAETIARFVGMNNVLAIPTSTVLGIPAYMNGYAAIPLIAGLMDLGMSPGAALAFVTAGAVSSFPAAMAVYALVRKPVFFVYIATGLAGSTAAGYLYQLF